MHGCRAWVLALALASSICGGAHGGGPDDVGDSDEGVQDDVLSTEQMHGIHQKIDANGDGKASMDEVLAFSDSVRRQIAAGDIPTVLEEIDVNRDGRVSLDEFLEDIGTSDDDDDPREAERKAAQKEAESAKFLVADTDKDGLLGTEELQSLFFPETHGGVLSVVARHALQERDRDGDGLLSLQEFWDGDSLEEDELLVSRTEQEAFRKLDADSSGKLDVKELEAWESGRFHVEEAVKSLSAPRRPRRRQARHRGGARGGAGAARGLWRPRALGRVGEALRALIATPEPPSVASRCGPGPWSEVPPPLQERKVLDGLTTLLRPTWFTVATKRSASQLHLARRSFEGDVLGAAARFVEEAILHQCNCQKLRAAWSRSLTKSRAIPRS
ncbi:unnamed protein product [Prorocentrum cordatum]|uniref:EF-hand domain-containing protein n=1 Tax=Prorocentrum cordatum TaxID=2364126 RepID=A0ABN9PIS6_9DINO|nr:unnamed protein product [Polarella glacialis]